MLPDDRPMITGIRREKLRGGGGGRTDRMRSVFGGVTDY
jgi:hypothetical protein